jgi:hypothetical protein
LGWDHQIGVVCLATAALTLAAAFFLSFPEAGLGAAVGLDSGLSGLAVFLVAVNLGSSGAPATGREGLDYG